MIKCGELNRTFIGLRFIAGVVLLIVYLLALIYDFTRGDGYKLNDDNDKSKEIAERWRDS